MKFCSNKNQNLFKENFTSSIKLCVDDVSIDDLLKDASYDAYVDRQGIRTYRGDFVSDVGKLVELLNYGTFEFWN